MTPNHSRAASISRAAAPPILIAVAVAIFLRFPPAQYSIYPQCPIYRYLDIRCPGCGTTRALAALLRGHLLEALRLNALTTILIVPASIYAILCYRRFLQRRPFLQLPSAAIYSALAVALVFAIARNLGHI